LGCLLTNGIRLHNVPQIMPVTLMVAVFAAGVSTILPVVDRRLHRG
jgi:ABC-type proline/glycine betaine transport system permease subunit